MRPIADRHPPREDGRTVAWISAERAARQSYGKLLAYLTWHGRDLTAAEDALAGAFAAALRRWPAVGVPDSPEAWLLTTARRSLLNAQRHRRVVETHAAEVTQTGALWPATVMADQPADIPDERLKLMFVCSHPAIDPAIRPALMLQTVLGLDAAQIAAAYLVAPRAMAQRLVRAKAKIRDAGIRFEEPEPAQRDLRVHSVLEAIYGAFGLGADDPEGDPNGLADEAAYLAGVVCRLVPGHAEALGLSALITLRLARRGSRPDPAAPFMPLDQQDVGRWDRAAILAGDRVLLAAAVLRRPGPLQIEAAIQSAHCQRLFTGQVPWPAIAALYARLMMLAPSIGATVGWAVATAEVATAEVASAEVEGAEAGLAILANLEEQAEIDRYQPFFVAKAHLAARAGATAAAIAAYDRALELTVAAPTRRFLAERRAALVVTPNAGQVTSR